MAENDSVLFLVHKHVLHENPGDSDVPFSHLGMQLDKTATTSSLLLASAN